MTVLPIPRAPVTRVSRSGAPEPSSIDSENRSVAHWRPRSSAELRRFFYPPVRAFLEGIGNNGERFPLPEEITG